MLFSVIFPDFIFDLFLNLLSICNPDGGLCTAPHDCSPLSGAEL